MGVYNNSGTITAVNSGGLSFVNNLTAGSFVAFTNAGTGPGIAQVTIGGSYTGTIVPYFSADGTNLEVIPASSVSKVSTNAVGAIANNAVGTYTFGAPAGSIFLIATALSAGTPTALVGFGESSSSSSTGGGSNGVGSVSDAQATNATGNWSLVSLTKGQFSFASPLCGAIFDLSGTGSTVNIEYTDINGVVVPVVDTNGGVYPSLTIAVGSSAAVGISFQVLATKPGGTYFVTALPTTAVTMRGEVVSGSVSVNTGGLVTGAAGTGTNGCNTGYSPASTTPRRFNTTDVFVIGAGK